jgi:hypothetical protein
MKSAVLGLMFVSVGVQANWTEDLATGPSQFNGDGGSLPVIVGTAPDAVGDAFGSGTPNLDISGMSAFLSGGNVSISMNFATPISPADAGDPESVIGFIELDIDQDPLTGNASAFDFFCPQPTQLGTEFIIDLGSVAAGQVGVDDVNLGPVGTAPISFTATGFTIDLPLSMIGNPANMHMASVIGTFGEPTDCAPDAALLAAGVPSIPVPTLSRWMLVLMALLMLVFTTRSLRRNQ